MTNIEHWEHECPDHPGAGLVPADVYPPEYGCGICGRKCENVKYVPAEQLRGAVEENERLRSAIALARLRLDSLPVSPRLMLAMDELDAALDGGQYEPRPVEVDVHSRPDRGARQEQGSARQEALPRDYYKRQS